jgi:hypothetical protein
MASRTQSARLPGYPSNGAHSAEGFSRSSQARTTFATSESPDSSTSSVTPAPCVRFCLFGPNGGSARPCRRVMLFLARRKFGGYLPPWRRPRASCARIFAQTRPAGGQIRRRKSSIRSRTRSDGVTTCAFASQHLPVGLVVEAHNQLVCSRCGFTTRIWVPADRNVSPAANEHDRAGQTGMSLMTS